MPEAKILIVEDEGIEALDIQQRLLNLGYPTPDIAFSGEEAIARARATTPDLVLMDVMLHGEIDGITAAKQIKACLEIPVIYLTAYSDEETLQRAKLTEPYGYIVKPFKERELYITINMALYRHEMERKLKESEQRFATTLKSIGDAVIAADAEGLITFMNPVAENLTGWKQAEAARRHLGEVFKTVDTHSRQPVEDLVTRVLREGTTAGLNKHTLLITRSGEEIPVDENAAPIKDDKEQRIIGVVLVFRDVTERKLAEEALRASEENYRALAEKLREADCRKNEFMAVLSHELRNPLAAICNSLSLLEQRGDSRAERVWEIIERQIGQLTRLVDDLLDITRITQGKIKLQLQRLELNELVQKTVEDHRPLFEKKGVHLAVDTAPSAVFVNADQARLVQVVGNLLQNAAKFTDYGGRTCVSVKSDPRKSQAVISVADTGVGIAPELFPRLFTPFMQADISLDRSRGGLGLGLALCKGLLELHGGDIDAYSGGTGRGAEFVIHLPLAKSVLQEQHRAPAAASGHRRRVLIVDDNVDLADSLCELLELNDHEVTVAYNGLEGIDRAREFRPEILLCDIGLPGMNGYDVARVFREDEELRHIYLVALTGYALPDDLQRASAAGFSCHLAKPVDLAELMHLLDRLPDRGDVLPVTR